MNHKMFTIFDEKAKAYLTPFFLPESGMAVRTFADCVNSETHQFGKHPSDYTLFTLGVWDDSDAQLNMFDRSISLGNGVEFIQPTKKDLQQIEDEYLHETPSPETPINNDAPILPGAEGGNSEV